MKIFTGKTELYLKDTQIENLFISEYMIPAHGDYVKVYLMASMYADSDQTLSNDTLAKYLNLSLTRIQEAWDYWESCGVIKKHISGPDPTQPDIEFVSLRQLMYGKTQGNAAAKANSTKSAADVLNSAAFSAELTSLFSVIEKLCRRPLSPKECHDVRMWLEEWGLTENVIIKAYDICVNERKRKPEHGYISTIIKDWYGKGLNSMDKLDDYLSEHDRKHNSYKRIFQALGFIGRYPSEEEKRIMDIWLEEYNLDMSVILEACGKTAGISNPSIKYVHAILADWKKSDKVAPSGRKQLTNAQIKSIYEDIRKNNAAEAERRKNEVYSSVPRIRDIDGELAVLNPKRLQLMLSKQTDTDNYRSMEKEILNLRKEKKHLLTDSGFHEDYLKPVYTCSLCKDSGYLDNGEKCICLKKRLMEQ